MNLYGLTLDSNNNVYVAHSSSHSVIKYNSRGERLATIGKNGDGDGQFGDYNSPRDVAITRQGTIYAIDYDKSRIEKFDRDGHFLALWNLPKSNTGRRTDAMKIAVDSREQIYLAISDTGVWKYSSSGNFLGTVGADLPSKYNLKNPWDLALDDNDNLFVAQPLKVYKFDATGKFITNWPIKLFDHINENDINSLQNIGLDHQGNIYINDENIIEKFDSAGNFLLSWTIKTNDKYIWEITGIATDSENRVYILNDFQQQVEIFDGQGRPLNQWSIGWPKWLQVNQPFFYIVFYPLIFINPVLGFVERRLKKRYGLPVTTMKFRTFKEYLIARTTTGRVSQMLIIAGSIIGVILNYLSFIGVYNIFQLPSLFVFSGLSIGQASLAVFIIFFNAILAYTAFLVPKNPLLAGIMQLLGVMLLLALTPIDPLKLGLNVFPVLVGSIMAIRSTPKITRLFRPGSTGQ